MSQFLRTITLASAVAIFLPVSGPAGQAVDPIIGTWELNLAKSTYSPGPAPRSETRTFEAAGDAVRYTAKGIDAAGHPTLRQYTAKYDGKDYPATGNPDSDTIAWRHIDAFTAEHLQKQAGRVVIRSMRVVAKDGRTFTFTSKGTNAAGQTVSNVLVFERR